MRLGIIGAGAAGLTTAWLLNDRHTVTLFEKQNRLGGHAETALVDREREQIPVDAALSRYPVTATFYTTDNRHNY